MWGWPALLKGVVVTYIESDDVINWSAHVSINGGDSWLPTLERALIADDAEPVAGGAVAPASKSGALDSNKCRWGSGLVLAVMVLQRSSQVVDIFKDKLIAAAAASIRSVIKATVAEHLPQRLHRAVAADDEGPSSSTGTSSTGLDYTNMRYLEKISDDVSILIEGMSDKISRRAACCRLERELAIGPLPPAWRVLLPLSSASFNWYSCGERKGERKGERHQP